MRVAYKRYAGLYFIVGIDDGDNELHTLDIIHHYVVVLDKHFGNVCELDLIFNFDKAYYMLCLLYTSPSPRDATLSRMPSSA